MRKPALYVDTCVFVAAFEDQSAVNAPTRKLFRSLSAKKGLAVTSELNLAELLAPTSNTAMSVLQRRELYLTFFESAEAVVLLQIKRDILLETATLRGRHSHRLPDAIHLATATLSGCDFFMSSDRDARRAPAGLTWLTPSQHDVDDFLAMHA